MTPDDLKSLRKELGCTAKELANAIGTEQATVLAWEKGELFPTKPYIDKMNLLRARGPASVPKKARGEAPMKVLADPAMWELFRKIISHKKLRDEVIRLASTYSDPSEEA